MPLHLCRVFGEQGSGATPWWEPWLEGLDVDVFISPCRWRKGGEAEGEGDEIGIYIRTMRRCFGVSGQYELFNVD